MPAQTLSTTYLISQRVRQTFTGGGKVFTLLSYYVSWETRLQPEILLSREQRVEDVEVLYRCYPVCRGGYSEQVILPVKDGGY